MAVGLCNYIDRLCMSILQVPIKQELGLTDTQLGVLTGLAFSLLYTTMTVPIARLADQTARKYVIAGALLVWSLMTVCCGFAGGFLMLAVLRMGVAIGEAGCVPSTHALLAGLFPLHQRARALASWQLVFPLGALVGMAASGWLNAIMGWRYTFMLLGAIGLCLAPLVLLTLREPSRGDRSQGHSLSNAPALREALRTLWGSRAFRNSAIGGALMAYPLNAELFWNAPFYSRAFGLSLRELSAYLSLLSGGAGAIGLYGAAVIADRLGRVKPASYMLVPAYAGLGVPPLMLMQYFATDAHFSLLLGIVPVMLLNAFMPPQAAATQSLFHVNLRALAAATNVLISGTVGAAIAPLATGFISDVLVSRYALDKDSLRYAIGCSCVFAALGGCFFMRAARYLPEELARNNWTSADPGAVAAHYGT
jgi:MFS family permease